MNKIRTYLFSTVMLIFSFTPLEVFAHVTEAEHEKELILDKFIMYSLVGTAILSIFFVANWVITNRKINTINVKKKDGRKLADKLLQKVKIFKWLSILSIAALIISGVLNIMQSNSKEQAVSFPHMHGLDFTQDGKEIYVPAHDGLRIYSNGQWTIPEGENNDYMGFSMVNDGFYSSGHPGPDSNMKNPFGVVKSTDGGKTIDILDEKLYGVIDFHGLDAGYESHAIYAFNPQPNERMDEVGLYYTLDETKTWTQSKMVGLDGEPTTLAVHPTEESVVAIGTKQGVVLSNDFGDTFKNVRSDIQVTALTFDSQGKLLVGGVNLGNGDPVILEVDTKTNESTAISIPSLTEDAIQYISRSPVDVQKLVIATFSNNIYLTENNGQSWEQLVDEGTGTSKEVEEN